jgi:hypothetical protein
LSEGRTVVAGPACSRFIALRAILEVKLHATKISRRFDLVIFFLYFYFFSSIFKIEKVDGRWSTASIHAAAAEG